MRSSGRFSKHNGQEIGVIFQSDSQLLALKLFPFIGFRVDALLQALAGQFPVRQVTPQRSDESLGWKKSVMTHVVVQKEGRQEE